MEIYLKKDKMRLAPATEEDLEKLLSLDNFVVYKVQLTKPRNYQFHKKAMALFKIGCENSKNVTMPFNVYRKYATMKAGFYEIYDTPNGKLAEAESLSFASMDETRFQEVYNAVLEFIIRDTQATQEMIEKELSGFI